MNFNDVNLWTLLSFVISVKNPEKRAIFIEQIAQLSQQYKSDVLYGSLEVSSGGVVYLSTVMYIKSKVTSGDIRSCWVSQGYVRSDWTCSVVYTEQIDPEPVCQVLSRDLEYYLLSCHFVKFNTYKGLDNKYEPL